MVGFAEGKLDAATASMAKVAATKLNAKWRTNVCSYLGLWIMKEYPI